MFIGLQARSLRRCYYKVRICSHQISCVSSRRELTRAIYYANTKYTDFFKIKKYIYATKEKAHAH